MIIAFSAASSDAFSSHKLGLLMPRVKLIKQARFKTDVPLPVTVQLSNAS
jgi:hypothetical protein